MSRNHILWLIPLACLLGCNSEPSIKGTWEATDGRSVTLTFGMDTAEWEAEAFGQTLKLSGDYTREKNRIKFRNLKVPGAEQIAAMVAPKVEGVDLEAGVDAVVSFKNNDEIVVSGHRLLDGTYRRKTN